ncbi:hypothetical protein H8N03_13085 [Ramlibacter sp. USB13]|uniref:Uncharacterized protein n=1 Tax=Ramlibacter cellulosilyticus TaxID=2764187 RepID=A0A923MSN2_9BURK|nr:hypothetical protein [Ramlibacter cellulosilyticus]MBC5783884.1 hypothetical protein [Ramlibacter cellulosilyticus]
MRILLATPLLALASGVHAHPGHGISEPWHWHASDTWGFLLVAALAALAIWLSRGE